MIKNFFAKLKSRKKSASELLPLGFHGDKILINIIDEIIKDRDYFIETGTNAGSTLSYIARTYHKVECFSCEPHLSTFKLAQTNVCDYKNVNLMNKDAETFLNDLDRSLFNKPVLFWLDAHGYGFTWPLRFEVNYILSNFKNAIVLIDDFKVPHIPAFLYDEYKGQSCTYEYIKDSIPAVDHQLYYPNYKQKTSEFHPLKGWCMFTIGVDVQSIEANANIINASTLQYN